MANSTIYCSFVSTGITEIDWSILSSFREQKTTQHYNSYYILNFVANKLRWWSRSTLICLKKSFEEKKNILILFAQPNPNQTLVICLLE